MKTWMLAAAAALALGSAAHAQTRLTAENTGIKADPCVGHKEGDIAFDWPNLCRYAAADAALPAPKAGEAPRVVFMGDSITQIWKDHDPAFFAPETGRIDRGISGQVTGQMVLRMMADVVDLHPAVVHIWAGTNDVAGNYGPETMKQVEENFEVMGTIAKAHHIKVIIGSTLPADQFAWRAGIQPAQQIIALNHWLRAWAAREGFTWADYTAVFDDGHGAAKPGLTSDHVHPTTEGYKLLEPVTLAAIDRALGRHK